MKTSLSDLICRSAGGDLETFNGLQGRVEMVRVILAILICPTMGLICDFIMGYWKNYDKGSREVQYPVPALVTFVTVRDSQTFKFTLQTLKACNCQDTVHESRLKWR